MSSLKTRLKKLSGKNKVSEASDSDEEYKEDDSTEERSKSNKGLNDEGSDYSEGDDNITNGNNRNSQKNIKVCIDFFIYWPHD
jgi:hypothetical protein